MDLVELKKLAKELQAPQNKSAEVRVTFYRVYPFTSPECVILTSFIPFRNLYIGIIALTGSNWNSDAAEKECGRVGVSA